MALTTSSSTSLVSNSFLTQLEWDRTVNRVVDPILGPYA